MRKSFNNIYQVDNIPEKQQEFWQKIDQRCTWIDNREDEEKREIQASNFFEMIQESVKLKQRTMLYY